MPRCQSPTDDGHVSAAIRRRSCTDVPPNAAAEESGGRAKSFHPAQIPVHDLGPRIRFRQPACAPSRNVLLPPAVLPSADRLQQHAPVITSRAADALAISKPSTGSAQIAPAPASARQRQMRSSPALSRQNGQQYRQSPAGSSCRASARRRSSSTAPLR